MKIGSIVAELSTISTELERTAKAVVTGFKVDDIIEFKIQEYQFMANVKALRVLTALEKEVLKILD